MTETHNSKCILNQTSDDINIKTLFKAVPLAVCKRLSNRTTIMEANKNPTAQNLPTKLSNFATHMPTAVAKTIPTSMEELQLDNEAKAFKQAEDESNNQKTERERLSDVPTCGENLSIQSSKAPRQLQSAMAESVCALTWERFSHENCPTNTQLVQHPTSLSMCLSTS